MLLAVGIDNGVIQNAVKPGQQALFIAQLARGSQRFEQPFLQHIFGILWVIEDLQCQPVNLGRIFIHQPGKFCPVAGLQSLHRNFGAFLFNVLFH